MRNSETIKIIGARMREAREIAGFSQSKAAKLLGYANSSRLNKIECATDVSRVGVDLVIRASKLYDVSADFLLGLSDDWERDVMMLQQKQIGVALLEHWERARASELNAIRILNNKLVAVQKAVQFGIQRSRMLNELVTRFRELNSEFDDLKLGAKLLRFAVETVEEANGISLELKRYQAYIKVADKSANVALKNADIFEMED